MTGGPSKTLANTGRACAAVNSVAISSDGQLVAAGGSDDVRDLQSFGGVYSEHSSYRWYISGTLAPVNCWRRCGDTETRCRV